MPEKSWIKKEYCFLYDKKTPSLQNSEEDDSYRVTTSIHLHLTVQTLSGTVIPYRYNRRILSQSYQKYVVWFGAPLRSHVPSVSIHPLSAPGDSRMLLRCGNSLWYLHGCTLFVIVFGLLMGLPHRISSIRVSYIYLFVNYFFGILVFGFLFLLMDIERFLKNLKIFLTRNTIGCRIAIGREDDTSCEGYMKVPRE